MSKLSQWLAHPLTRGKDLDDPHTTQLRKQVIKEKRLLQEVYATWYSLVQNAIPQGQGRILELGAGAGSFKDVAPESIRSDILPLQDVELVCSGTALPFADNTLKAVVGFNVLHHIPDIRDFFAQTARCVRPEGAVIFLEPWVTPFSKFVYSKLHYEPFEPKAKDWELPPAGPLSGANNALPWIVFHRDKSLFLSQFPEWEVSQLLPLSGLSYYLSGGVSMRTLIPQWANRFSLHTDALLSRAAPSLCALFCLIHLQRKTTS